MLNPDRSSPSRRRLHPTRHLGYAFAIGAGVTAIGFVLAAFDAPPAGMASKDGRSAARGRETLVVAGSETLRPLLSACAEAFMHRHRQVDVVVRGGGSSTGVSALLGGQIDLAMSSRGCRLPAGRCRPDFEQALTPCDVEARRTAPWRPDACSS